MADFNEDKVVVTDNEWVDVKREAFPEVGADDYIYIVAKKETAAAIILDKKTLQYVMRMEGTLYSNFAPTVKIMTETIEPGETPEIAVVRGVEEEFGIGVGYDINVAYLGTINGTFQELHNYYIYFIVMDYEKTEFEGDGSIGEEKSDSLLVDGTKLNITKDFLTWIAYGMLQQGITRGDDQITALLDLHAIDPNLLKNI